MKRYSNLFQRRNRIMLVLMLLFTGFQTETFATHFMGGEIRWECLPNGNYRFIMIAYKECAAVATFNTEETLSTTVPGFAAGIKLKLYPDDTLGRTDISPVCNQNPLYPRIACPTATYYVPHTGAIQQWYFTSDAYYPNGVQLNGIPPTPGWDFYWEGSARNACTNIINADGKNWCLFARMYSNFGQNANPCFDNSPIFAERPQIVVPTGIPISYNPTAYDLDGDSITYAWSQPLEGYGNPIYNSSYASGYTYQNPLPGVVHNPNNVPAVLDGSSGQLTFTSFTSGAFTTDIKVIEYRNGNKIAEIVREMQVVILNSGNNSPPYADIYLTPTNGNYIDTVYAGQTVSFSFSAIDTGLLNNGIDPQNVSVDIDGLMMGTRDTGTCGCPMPPCAHLNEVTPVSGLITESVYFTWETSINHLIFGGLQNPYVDYYFVCKTQDDYCPVPGITMIPVKIVVKDFVLPPPVMSPVQINTQTGNVTINWVPVPNDSTNSFRYYLIYYRNPMKGSYHVIDTIFDINTTSYTHVGALNISPFFWYKILTVSGHAGAFLSAPSDEITNYVTSTSEIESTDIKVDFDAGSSSIRISGLPCGNEEPSLSLYNTTGQIVFQSGLSQGNSKERVVSLNVTPGIYLYQIHCGKELIKGKIRID